MRPKNFTERRKRLLTFTGLYAASIILMFFIFSAFGVRFSVNDQKAGRPVNELQPAAEDYSLQHADSLLHTNLRELQQLDNQYTVLRADSNATTSNNVAMIIGYTEQAFKKTIDSIELAIPDNAGEGRKMLYKTMIGSFRAVLNERVALKNMLAAAAAGKAMPGLGQQDALMWKDELARKEYEIARLDAEIKTLQGSGARASNTSTDAEAQKWEAGVLKTEFNDQQKEYEALKESYKHLKADNGLLAAQIVEFKKAASQAEPANAAADNKVHALEQKMEALNADLYFAKIDCNLARTDAQQMISNARQRKELLSESLMMLNGLAKSEDADIQKKAKDKIARLNRIANTLHD